jgi:hypothetical protein
METRDCGEEITLCQALGLDRASYTRAELETLLRAGEDEDDDSEAA